MRTLERTVSYISRAAMILSLVSISVPIVSSFSTSCVSTLMWSKNEAQRKDSWTNLDVTNNRFSLLLDLGEALLHPFVLLQSLVLSVHQLPSTVRIVKGGWNGHEELTVMAFTRLFADWVAPAICVRIFGFS